MKVQSTAHQEWGLYKDMEKKLFDRVKLGNIEIKNRLIRSATWEGLADVNGHLPETLYHTYEELAKGGVGAIITGFTSVADDDRYFGGMARLSNDGLISEHQTIILENEIPPLDYSTANIIHFTRKTDKGRFGLIEGYRD